MAEELAFKDKAAAEHGPRLRARHRGFRGLSWLRAAHIAPGMHVLDIATGTGLSGEVALAAVGPTGHVIAAEISPAMAEKARERLAKRRMRQSLWRTGRRFRSPIAVSMQDRAISV